MKGDNKKQQYRINEQIRVHDVRIVGEDIESTVMPTRDALRLAEEKGVDLVEISPLVRLNKRKLIKSWKRDYMRQVG